MKSIQPENIAEHSQHAALVAHALAVIDAKVFCRDINPDRVAMLALYHETGEVITGDLPTPIKYFSPEISTAYKNVEAAAEQKLLSALPKEIKDEIACFVAPDKDSYEYKLVKYADKLSAYAKCLEELRCRNSEFKSAHQTIKSDLDAIALDNPCVKYFMDKFMAAYSKNLDELT